MARKKKTNIRKKATKTIIILLLIITTYSYYWTYLNYPPTINHPVEKDQGKYKILICPEDHCETTLSRMINQSETIKCAFYDLDDEKIIKAIKEREENKRRKNNKETEILLFKKNYDDEEELKSITLIKPITNPSRGLMHDKFCIINKTTVVTGSANPTTNGLTKNNNNLIIIQSKLIAENYLSELKELEQNSTVDNPTPHPIIELKIKNKITNSTKNNTILIKNLFCPEDHCEENIINELKKAKKSILFLTFSFTSDKIGETIIKKWESGLDIRGVFEKRTISQYSEYKKLKEEGIPVSTDNNPATMHHKVFVIDNQTIIIGSYNPTRSADTRNDENIIIITPDHENAERFYKEYEKVRINN